MRHSWKLWPVTPSPILWFSTFLSMACQKGALDWGIMMLGFGWTIENRELVDIIAESGPFVAQEISMLPDAPALCLLSFRYYFQMIYLYLTQASYRAMQAIVTYLFQLLQKCVQIEVLQHATHKTASNVVQRMLEHADMSSDLVDQRQKDYCIHWRRIGLDEYRTGWFDFFKDFWLGLTSPMSAGFHV